MRIKGGFLKEMANLPSPYQSVVERGKVKEWKTKQGREGEREEQLKELLWSVMRS
ncbi:MAG: hypothetical protein R2880_09155 [Deinococcales bacterium]